MRAMLDILPNPVLAFDLEYYVAVSHHVSDRVCREKNNTTIQRKAKQTRDLDKLLLCRFLVHDTSNIERVGGYDDWWESVMGGR